MRGIVAACEEVATEASKDIAREASETEMLRSLNKGAEGLQAILNIEPPPPMSPSPALTPMPTEEKLAERLHRLFKPPQPASPPMPTPETVHPGEGEPALNETLKEPAVSIDFVPPTLSPQLLRRVLLVKVVSSTDDAKANLARSAVILHNEKTTPIIALQFPSGKPAAAAPKPPMTSKVSSPTRSPHS